MTTLLIISILKSQLKSEFYNISLPITLSIPGGGTRVYEPLETIFKQEVGDGCKRQIFVLTDGHVSQPQVIIRGLVCQFNTWAFNLLLFSLRCFNLLLFSLRVFNLLLFSLRVFNLLLFLIKGQSRFCFHHKSWGLLFVLQLYGQVNS